MSLYRDNYEASLSRVTALEKDLEQIRQQQRYDQATISALRRQLRVKQSEARELAAMVSTHPVRSVEQPARITNAVVVFVLAVFSLLIAHPLGPLAWIAANRELRQINTGFSDAGNRPMVVAGKVLGITATAIFVVSALMFIIAIIGVPCRFDDLGPCGY